MLTDADTMLHRAAQDGQPEWIEVAIAAGADINARDDYGDTALNKAAEKGHLAIVQRLVGAGANLENVGGAAKTPLMGAAFAGQVNVTRYLLDQGARINRDLLSSMQLKVNILEENAELGMVKPEAVTAWQGFLDYLVQSWQYQEQLDQEQQAGASASPETH